MGPGKESSGCRSCTTNCQDSGVEITLVNGTMQDRTRVESTDCRSDLERAVLHNARAPFSLTKHAKRSCIGYESTHTGLSDSDRNSNLGIAKNLARKAFGVTMPRIDSEDHHTSAV
jgi:hypothetical protein